MTPEFQFALYDATQTDGVAGDRLEDRRRVGHHRALQRHDRVGADDLRADASSRRSRRKRIGGPSTRPRSRNLMNVYAQGAMQDYATGDQPDDPGGAHLAVVRLPDRARTRDADGRRERDVPRHDAHAVRDRDPARVPVPRLDPRRPADGRRRRRQPGHDGRPQRADRSPAGDAAGSGEPHEHHDRLVQRPADVLEDQGHQPVLGARDRRSGSDRRWRTTSTPRRSSS